MFAKNVSDFKACVKDGVPCKLLLGFFTEDEWKKLYGESTPYMAHGRCQIGYECGRGMCFRYDASELQ